MTVINSLDKALYAIKKLIESVHDQLEGAPKPEDNPGPVAKNLWRVIRNDLADLPRGERYLIRKKGGKTKDYIVVCLPAEPSTALVGYSPDQIEAQRQVDAARWEAMQMMASALEYKAKALDTVAELQSESMDLITRGIGHANSANEKAELIQQMIEAYGELSDELTEEKGKGEMARAANLFLHKIADTIKLHSAVKKAKSFSDLQVTPEFQREWEEFLAWKREKSVMGDEGKEEPTGDDSTPPPKSAKQRRGG